MQHRRGAKIRSVVPRDYKRDEVREYRLYDSSSQGLVLYLPRARGEFGRFRGRCLGRQPKTGVVLRRLLDLPRLPARSALRTAVPLLLILRTGGGTGTTFTSGATTASVYSKPPRASKSFGHHMYPNSGIDCSGHRTTVCLRRAPLKLTP